MPKRTRIIPITLAAACLSYAIAPAAPAATVGYWRFEGSASVDPTGEGNFLDDSGPNDLDLVISGSVAQTATPFPNPVPSTGQPNTRTADFGTSQSGHFGFIETGANELNLSDFTIEAFVRLDVSDTTAILYIASEFTTTGNNRAWALGMGEGSGTRAQGEVVLLLSEDGAAATVIESNLTELIQQGDLYYVAAIFDESNQASGVTFVIQNLTDGVTEFATIGHPINTLHQPVTVFRIGTFNNDASRRWQGLIDEVRLSDTPLGLPQLLVAIPTPAALPAGLSLLAIASMRRRRRR